jgi:hypothetical protein
MFPTPAADYPLRAYLSELLQGGFAPNVILWREFHYDKAGIVLDGLHFSAWILLGHVAARQGALLRFMQDPLNHPQVWEDAYWPENPVPASEPAWQEAINHFEAELNEMIRIVQNPASPLFEVQPNGKTLAWAALTALHHNGYHTGQLKTIGRQLGVW